MSQNHDKKLRIALVIERMDAALGGRETSTAQIGRELARRGHEVTVVCQSGTPPAEGVQVVCLGPTSGFRVERLRRFVAAVQQHIADGPYDVVHAMLPVVGADVYQPRGGTVPAQRAASLRRRGRIGRAVVGLFEPLNLRRGCMQSYELEAMAQEHNLCLAVSSMVAAEFAQHYQRTRRCRVVYNAVDVPDAGSPQRAEWRPRRRDQLGVGDDATVFLTAAMNFELKGIPEAATAFGRWYNSRLRMCPARLVVLGQEVPVTYLAEIGIRDVGPDEVVFLPATDEIFSWYAAADAVVLLSWYDPCSRVVLEATRWAIPSLTTVYNGAAEVLADGAGIVVESPSHTQAVMGALADLADPDRRAARAEHCRQVAPSLTMQRHVDELLDAYAEVVKIR